MTIETISIANDELVVVARKDFEALMEKAGVLPSRPKPDKNGNVDAFAAIDVSIARSLITDRIKRGWTQTELARRSGVRLETISRIEAGKHCPRQETLLKLDRALLGKAGVKCRPGKAQAIGSGRFGEHRGLELPWTFEDGKNADECFAKLREAMAETVAFMLSRGETPPVPAGEARRTAQVNIRITPQEKSLLEQVALSHGYHGVSDYVRDRVLSAG